jgi:signal transduction histidine kinase
LKMDTRWLDKRLPKDQETLRNKTAAMAQLIDQGVETVQRISSELRPGLLDEIGISAAIEWQAKEFTERTGIKHTLTVVPESIVLASEHSTAIFRIFQGALTNVMRHADATKVDISLIEKDDELTLTVADNGKGISPEEISDSKSLGLLGMQERARYFGGKVEISGVRDKGTTVAVRIPLIK